VIIGRDKSRSILNFIGKTMDKIKIKFPEVKNEIINFNNQEIVVGKYIDATTKKILSTVYYNLLNNEEVAIEDRYFYAEIYLILTIIKLCTNIEYENGKEEEFINNVIKSGLWYKLKDIILNYSELRRELGSAIQYINLENSLNKSINMLAFKLSDLIDKISEIDFSDIDIEKLNKVLEELRQERININETLNGRNEVKEIVKIPKKIKKIKEEKE